MNTDYVDEFENYDRKLIKLNSDTVILLHIFKKSRTTTSRIGWFFKTMRNTSKRNVFLITKMLPGSLSSSLKEKSAWLL